MPKVSSITAPKEASYSCTHFKRIHSSGKLELSSVLVVGVNCSSMVGVVRVKVEVGICSNMEDWDVAC